MSKLEDRKVEYDHVEDEKMFDKDAAAASHTVQSAQVQAAIAAGEAETKLPLSQLFKIYYPAALWSMALSAALVMDGMDTGLVCVRSSLAMIAG
jgi:hypothetical protein